MAISLDGFVDVALDGVDWFESNPLKSGTMAMAGIGVIMYLLRDYTIGAATTGSVFNLFGGLISFSLVTMLAVGVDSTGRDSFSIPELATPMVAAGLAALAVANYTAPWSGYMNRVERAIERMGSAGSP
jgi:hypothetical protein